MNTARKPPPSAGAPDNASTSFGAEETLTQLLKTRHSTRIFTPHPVPPSLLLASATLAQRAPSNSNIQPWRLTLAQGAPRNRIVAALSAAARESGPRIPPLPEAFAHHREDFVRLLYGDEGYGVLGGEKVRVDEARMRNFRFFDAPVVGVVSLHRDLVAVDAMTVGMFMQAFLLALAERGLGSCLMVSVAGFPEVLRREFGLGEEQIVLCGVAVGYEDMEGEVGGRVNGMRTGREAVEGQVVLLGKE